MRAVVTLLILICVAHLALGQTSAFTDAQVAAAEGRYEDVVAILSSVMVACVG